LHDLNFKAKMFHPSALGTVIFDSLSEAQQEAAAGRFSDPNVLHKTDVMGTISYFTKDLPATIRQVIQSRSKALLFTKKASFKILSSPTVNLDTITKTTQRLEVFKIYPKADFNDAWSHLRT
jgi:hypothetical protein